MQNEIEVMVRDAFSSHGEGIVRSRYAADVRERWLTWPQIIGVPIEEFDFDVIVARVNGVVAGRAILEAVYYPFAELENLEVVPAFRGRGIGGQIVADAIRKSADKGFLAIHLQTDLDNVAAHRLYARHGFLAATQGEKLKLVRFLNYPALSHFLWEYPLALFDSRPVESFSLPVWELSWTNPIGKENLAIQIYGGSCQADSDDLGPAISSFQLESGVIHLKTNIRAPRALTKGQMFNLEINIANLGSKDLEGACRLLLNPGFRPAPDTLGSAKFCLKPESSEKIVLPVELLASFNDEVFKICAFDSVSTVAEIFIGDYIFWLSCQHNVEQAK
jgi:GNAT superfamily N-acetyltransferase